MYYLQRNTCGWSFPPSLPSSLRLRVGKFLAEISTWRQRTSKILAELAKFPTSRRNSRRDLGMALASIQILAKILSQIGHTFQTGLLLAPLREGGYISSHAFGFRLKKSSFFKSNSIQTETIIKKSGFREVTQINMTGILWDQPFYTITKNPVFREEAEITQTTIFLGPSPTI